MKEIWTKEEFLQRYKTVCDKIQEIEFPVNKSRRQEWRELQKIKKWLESHFHEYGIDRL